MADSPMTAPTIASMTTSFSSSSTSMPLAGSLMTAFTAPSYCTNVIKSSCTLTTPYSGSSTGTPYTSCAYVERDLTCGSDGQATRASECFPNNPYPYSSLLWYSPATGCPDGWKTESQIIDTSSQTTAVCCPSGYSAHTYYASCTKAIDYTDSSTNVLSCSRGGSLVRDWITSSDTYDAETAVWAMRLQVILATASAEDPTVTPFGEPTSTNGVDSSEPNSDTPTSDPKRKSGLGTGPIVGIIVGAVAVLLLVGALFFFWQRRRNQHHHAPIPKASPSGEHDALPELVGGPGTTTAPVQMTAASSNGLFQPQPEVRSPR